MIGWLVSAGLFVGGILASMAVEAATGKAIGLLVRQRFLRRARQRLAQYRLDEDYIRLEDEGLFINQFVPGGYAPGHIEIVEHQPAPAEARLATVAPELLPGTADWLVSRIEAERARLATDASEWNGPSLAVESISTLKRRGEREEPQLELVVHVSDHASAVACSTAWKDWFDERGGHVPGDLAVTEGKVGMLHAIGLNATLVTADNKLLLTRRNPQTSSGRDGLHISVNEGMLPTDRTNGRLDPYAGLIRGVEEELGVKIERHHVSIHTAMLDMRRYQFGFLGHIDLRGTEYDAAHLVGARRLGMARDKQESTTIDPIDWTYAEVSRLLRMRPWIAHGWLNLALSALQAFPSEAKAIAGLLNSYSLQAPARV